MTEIIIDTLMNNFMLYKKKISNLEIFFLRIFMELKILLLD